MAQGFRRFSLWSGATKAVLLEQKGREEEGFLVRGGAKAEPGNSAREEEEAERLCGVPKSLHP